MIPKRLTSTYKYWDDDIVCSSWRQLAVFFTRVRLTTLLNIKYSYGKKIFDKLNDMMNPQFEDETPVNPFDLWEGADFRLKVRQVEGYINYDKSEFDSPSAVYDGDEAKLEELYSQLHSLQALIAPDQFKTYEELEARLHRVLGITGNPSGSAKTADETIDEDLDMSKIGKTEDAPKLKESVALDGDSDDDDLSFFRDLANK